MLSNRVLCNLISRRFAGHSKWANIKHIKADKDAQKSALFTKLSRQIKIAIQEGGSINPELNSRLAQVIEQTKRNSMPAATVQNVIKSTQQRKGECKRGILEIKGPGGSFILCEVFTDNMIKCKQAIATVIKKYNAIFSDGGGKHLFEQKGVVEVSLAKNGTMSEQEILEAAIEHAIEGGAEDVTAISSDVLHFICEPRDVRSVEANIARLKYEVTSAGVEYIPKLSVHVDESELENLAVMFEKLESQEDVVKLYDNIG